MPSLAVTRKGIYTGGLDGNSDKKEERCFFGLLSLRRAIIIIYALPLLLPVATGFTTTREEFSTSVITFAGDIYIPIPFMDRGITSLKLYWIITSLIGLYGACNRSYRAIKISRMISYGEFVWDVGDLTWSAIKYLRMLPFTVTNKYIIDLAEKSGTSIDLYMTSYKGGCMCSIPFFIVGVAKQIHMLDVIRRYEEILAPEKDE
ncbi:hypothetical protein EDC94DRAFT_132674 [Helicostylum pulchrum]|nr:hypothetical protein EDC94DRAFT_132674 [Helicostylum pulchrum]